MRHLATLTGADARAGTRARKHNRPWGDVFRAATTGLWLAALIAAGIALAPTAASADFLTFVEAEFDGVGGVDGLDGAISAAVSPDGKHVYATGSLDDAVAVFSRDAATGALTFVEAQFDGVGGVDGLNFVTSVAVSPDGKHVYTAGQFDDAVAVFATPAATFLLIDEDSIDKDVLAIEALDDGSGDLINDAIADKGVRVVLPIPVGTVLTLPAGEVGDEGWFALKETSIPDTWDAAGPTADGLQNYIQAGPGLGTGPDPEVLLDKIPDVTPLRTAGLGLLVDTTVCAVVYKSDISINYDPLDGNLQGANRGLIAFDVVAVADPDPADSVLPEMTVEIVNAKDVFDADGNLVEAGACDGELTLLDDEQAPAPISSSEPSP